ncbi:MAG: AAA family ATPase [Actinomycetota bacterium]|nr:AAA family ATPase [Actinomycetota bacterium]
MANASRLSDVEIPDQTIADHGGESGFVGRRSELAAARALILDRAAGLSLLVVSGEPGIGKSRFLAEVRCSAEDQGWRAAVGQAVKSELELPFAGLADALTPLVLAEPAVLDRLPAHLAEGLADVLPVVRATSDSSLAGGRHRAHAAARALLEQLSSGRGVLLILDDLHWADGETTELIDHLIRHPPSGPVVLAIAYRPYQIPGQLAAVLSRAVTAGAALDVRLGPLGEAEARALLGDRVAPTVARRLHAAAEGNPRYLISLARAGVTGWPSLEPLPADVRAALGAEVEVLPTDVRTVLEAAAVLGAEFDPEPLPAVAGRPAPTVWSAVDELVAADLLRVDAESGQLRFRHPLVQHVVYQSTPPGRRRMAHVCAVRALTERAAPADLLAHHLARAARRGDESAVRVLVRAAAASRWQAPATAAHWYAAALRLLPVDRRHPARRGRLLLAQGECLLTAGRLTEAGRAISEALPLLQHRSGRMWRRALRVAARVSQLDGRWEAAAALLHRASGVDGTDVRLQLAMVELMRGDIGTALALARQVQDCSSVELGLGASSALAFVYAASGDVQVAATAAEAAGNQLDASSDAELARQLPAALWLIWANVTLARYHRALHDQDRLLQLARSGGQVRSLVHILVGKAETLRRIGRLAEARRCAEEADELGQLSSNREMAAFTATTGCLVAVAQGHVADAQRFGDDAEALAAEMSGVYALMARCTAAEARLLAGKPQECIAGLLAAGGGEELPCCDPGNRIRLYEVLTRAALMAGWIDDAQQWADRAVEVENAAAVPWTAGHATLAQAQVRLAQGDAEEAVRRAQQAVEEFDRVADNPLGAVRARLVAGRALSQLGRRGDALSMLSVAEETANRCGALGLRDEVTRELRRLGRRVSRPTRRGQPGAGIGALSDRQRQIAKLAAEGHTNRAIAATLYLSEKTVERHLSTAFAKLGVPSRAALAAQVATA